MNWEKKIYPDQTGKFPVHSSQGNQYLMIMCEIDSNAILMESMRDRTASGMIKTYQKMVDKLNACDIYPRHQVLENEILEEYKVTIQHNKVTFGWVLTRDHRRNIAEKGIQVVKAYLILDICWVAKNCCSIHI